MNRDVHLVAEYGPAGASARVRLYDWDAHLGLGATRHVYRGESTNGVREMLRDPAGLARAELGVRTARRAVRGQTVVLSRGASPLSSGGTEEALLRSAGHAVYDFDDAVMLPRDNWTARLFDRTAQWRRSVLAADVVIAGNPMLAEAASAIHPEVVHIPSCVDTDLYPPRVEANADRAPRPVWIGSPGTEQYLAALAPAVNRLYRERGTRLLVISGAGGTPPGFDPQAVERRTWGPGSYVADLLDGDVGVMPLLDTPWELGKCAYKLLQYGAAGLPVAGSPVGVNREVLARMGGTSVAEDQGGVTDPWYEALREALDLPATERLEAGRRARRVVEEEYSFRARAEEWLAAVTGTAG